MLRVVRSSSRLKTSHRHWARQFLSAGLVRVCGRQRWVTDLRGTGWTGNLVIQERRYSCAELIFRNKFSSVLRLDLAFGATTTLLKSLGISMRTPRPLSGTVACVCDILSLTSEDEGRLYRTSHSLLLARGQDLSWGDHRFFSIPWELAMRRGWAAIILSGPGTL
jgi:hypothetical protein